jgi:hypothetical protein
MTTYKSLRWIASLAAILINAHGVFSQETASSTREYSSTHESNNGTSRWKTSTGLTSFNIESRGKIEITDDDKDIKSMSDDGYLEISKTVFGSKRSIIIESMGGGKLKKEYYEGRSKMDWETAGKAWLGEILPEVVRTTTIGAGARVDRIFKQSGAQGVLNEIGKMESDYIKSHYGALLLEKNIPGGDLPNLITRLSENVNSDYYLSTLLKSNIGKLLATKESADAFFVGAGRINSAYYKSVLLTEALKKYAASPAQVKVILQSAGTINSDYYLSTVLTSLLEQDQVKDESLSELLIVSKKIPSAYYRMTVLNKAIEKPGLSKAALKNMVDAAAGINSDYYQTSVYNSMSERATIDSDVLLQVINQIAEVNSDYYGSVALRNILEHQKLSEEAFNRLVIVGSEVNSAYYSSEVLKEASKHTLNKSQLIILLGACENIDSDSYLAGVLMEVADQVSKSDDTVKGAYRKAARKIDSESYYGRALRAIE